MRKTIVGAAVVALIGGLTAVVPATQVSAATPVTLGPTTIAWKTCSAASGLADTDAKCATLKVPLDYAKPNGRKISLALSRVQHTSSSADFQGVLLTNPGGPGGSGLTLSTLGQYVPNGVGAEYDWIGWDPRGVGASWPSLSCLPKYQGYDRPKYVPSTKALLKTWQQRSKRYADACNKARPELIKHVKTRDSVKDMESIRKALGAPQITYYGFSYGTYLGAVYATQYPTKMRRMVLDGNVDPRSVWYQANLDQDVAFDRNIKIWFKWVAKYNNVYHLGTTQKAVEAQYYKQLNRLDKKAAGGKIGGDEWTDIFLNAGYYQSTWEELADVFAGWVHHGNWRALKAEYDSSATPGDDNGYAMYTATQCTDAKWPKKWSTWQKDNDRIYKKHKFLTWDNAWYNAPCLYWHVKAGTPVKVGAKTPSALLISETLDAATPWQGSLEMRKRFPKAVLIGERGGTTHAGSLYGNACVDNAIAAYLDTGARTARKSGRTADAWCAPLPKPVPGSASTSLTARMALPTGRDLVGRP